MGRPKMLLPWGRTSILGHLLDQWRSLDASQIAVVCAADQPLLHAELDRLEFPVISRILNSRPQDGMFSSVRCAASWNQWLAELTHWAIVLGDQPHLRLESLRVLLECCARHPTQICQPTYSGRPRHPAILPRAVFGQLGDSTAEHLKHFLQEKAGHVVVCRVDDPGLDFDLDEPADYERALRLFNVNPCLQGRGSTNR